MPSSAVTVTVYVLPSLTGSETFAVSEFGSTCSTTSPSSNLKGTLYSKEFSPNPTSNSWVIPLISTAA